MKLLTASPALLQDPRELSRVAKEAGHPLEPAAAGKFAERVLLDEAAYSLLQERHYKAFLHRLHTRAPVPSGGGGGAAAVAEPRPAVAAAAVPVSQPAPLAAVGTGGEIVSNPAVAVAAPASPRASRSGAAAPFVERTPPGGESKQERRNRLGRNRKRKRRAADEDARPVRYHLWGATPWQGPPEPAGAPSRDEEDRDAFTDHLLNLYCRGKLTAKDLILLPSETT